MSARDITIISASAGSGKTHRLTQDVTSSLGPKAGEKRVPLEGLVAVTFTRKAHAELASRIRQKLVSDGAYEEAMRLPLAYLGTVHAVCLRLLQEFALDAGLSPNVDVAGDDPSHLLRKALETALSATLRDRLDALSWRTELRIAQQIKRVDWHTPVYEIMELARANRIAPADLTAMGERSAESLLRLFPLPMADEAKLDRDLARTVQQAIAQIARADDGVKSTKDLLETLERAATQAEDGCVPWGMWAKLAKETAKKSLDPMLVPVREAAGHYESHPRLHADIRELTLAIYEAARVGLDAYEAWKRERHVIDYVDMLDGALDLLKNERVRAELSERLKLVVVDEFQDTSPIQLAVFVGLHALAKRSIWVGDRKQCIFEYAGADPVLMDRVAQWVAREGGDRDCLDANYRSRPELVEACSEIFTAALERYGLKRDEIGVRTGREAAPLGDLPPFGVWCLECSNAEKDAACIAEGVRRLLSDGIEVIDRARKTKRPVRAGDVAVLVATNEAAGHIADALHARGMRAALARSGLLGTPEGRLTDAALRWLHDRNDTLAAATIDALTCFDGGSPDAWLEERIRHAEPAADPATYTGWRRSLEAIRDRLAELSPAEALDLVVSAIDAVDLCVRWPAAPQRLANLDALRALAHRYEERCEREREAATVAGLLRFFDDLREERLHDGEMIAFDAQHIPSDDGAVVVSTYHKAKGLEWPVVVLGSLDRAERRNAFTVSPETDADGFNPESPLSGRWIRYWPWPFGAQRSVPLADEAKQSPEGRRVAAREEQERARLLYVGFTRARDHLVLAVRSKPLKNSTKVEKDWLDGLCDADGTSVLTLPTDAADGTRASIMLKRPDGSAFAIPTRVLRLKPEVEVATPPERTEIRWFASAQARARLGYRIRPSDEAVAWPEIEAVAANAKLGAIHRFASAITLDETKYQTDALGTAVHAFFAADVLGISEEERVARAKRLLGSAGLIGVIRAESVVRASDEFRSWLNAKWPDGRLRPEVRVSADVDTSEGARVADGIIDLLIETARGFVIVDHKTFPAKNESAIAARTLEYARQLAAYREMLMRAATKPVLGTFVHFPISGMVAECVL
jgi:ATP-dependent helicase/nuclease subunit A